MAKTHEKQRDDLSMPPVEEATATTNTAVATTSGNQLAQSEWGDALATTTGFENVRAQDVSLPFLKILESLSPELKKTNAAYIEGAEVGDIVNTVTRKLYKPDSGLVVVPCGMSAAYVEWKPKRGGYVQQHGSSIPKGATKSAEGYLQLNGNDLVETKYHFVLVVEPDGLWYQAVIAMTSTRMKSSRDWLGSQTAAKFAGRVAPSWCQLFEIGTGLKQKDTNEWYVWTFKPLGFMLAIEGNRVVAGMPKYEPILVAARAFTETVVSGDVVLDPRSLMDDAEQAMNVDPGIIEEVLQDKKSPV